jgi:putative ABC transport system ATP-binding protein
VIKLEDIAKTYPMGNRELAVLRGVSLSVETGEMVAIMGPSGSGKTTLLNILGCLDTPTSGSYYLDGHEIGHLNSRELAKIRGTKIGFIFQNFNLLPYLSAQQNVELGLKYSGGRDYHRAIEALDRVGLADRAKHRPNELSGGESQRVAIARALVKNPPLILADEPTGNLDSHSGEEVMNIIRELNREQKITLVLVTHDPDIAGYCKHVIHVKDGQILIKENN